MSELLRYIQEHEDKHLEELKELLRIPSVSAQDQHGADCRRAAEWVAEKLRRAGVDAKLMETGGHPVVYGEWLRKPGAPTVLVYGHYDVQPPEPLDKWTSPPFEPTVRDGKLWARGATDDKGQMFTHLAAAEAHMAVAGGLPVNVKYLIEGEEEISSVNIERFVAEHKEMLAADVVVISDTAMYDAKHPAITYALRGIVYYQLEVQGASSDLHSGIYGGAVPNPAQAVADILASCKDPKSGRVRIPGFYADVVKPTATERRNFAKLPFSDAKYAKELGLKKLHGEKGFSTLERTWIRPTFEVNGVGGGYQGPGAKTVLPASALAKVSMRLVANQNPEKIAKAFEKHVKAVAPPGVTVKLTRLGASPASRIPIDHPGVQAGAAALEKAFGRKVVYTAEGGSIPIVAAFQRELGLPSVLIGYGLHDENLHAPDEHLDLGNFRGGIRASALVLDELAARLAPGSAKRRK